MTVVTPRKVEVRLGSPSAATKMVVQIWRDASVTIAVAAGCTAAQVDLSADEAAELLAALSPDVADLREALELLANAVEELLPNPLKDDPETVAAARGAIDALRDVRAMLRGDA
jgi:hypothetical protein